VRWLVNWSLQFRALVFFVCALIIFLGATRLSGSRVDVLPEFAPPFIEIQTEALGLSAPEVEDLITLNLEELLSGTSWLRKIRSKSVPGLSSIVLIFEPGTDIMRARQLVQERLMFAYALPNVSKTPVMLNPLSATSRAMMIGVSSKDLSLIDLSVLVRFTIKPKLMGVPGVANVAIWGQRMRQLQVQVDPEDLRLKGVRLDQVIKTAGNAMWVSPLSYLEASMPGTGGWIDTPSQRLAIQHTQPISTPADLAQVAVAGTPHKLGDVAKVVEGHPPLIGDAIVGGEPGLLLVVEKFPQTDARDVVRGVDEALDSLRPGLPGVVLDASIFRSSQFVEMATENIGKAVLIGAILLVLALLFLFYDWRAALISALSILLSLLVAALVLYFLNATINVLVFAGFVAALIVVIDDAIVSVEGIFRRMDELDSDASRTPVQAVIVEALGGTRPSTVYALLIIVLSVLPAFLIAGLPKAFFDPLAASYLLALLASFVVAMTATPAIASVLFRRTPSTREPPVRALRRLYELALARTVDEPRAVGVATAAVVLVALGIWPLFGQSVLPKFSLLPQFDERDVRITWKGVPGTSYPETQRVVSRISRELQSIPGVSNVSAHVGRAVTGDQVVGVESGQIWVNIDPAADSKAIFSAIKSAVAGYPGADHDMQTYLQETVRGVFTGTHNELAVRIRGPDWEGLRREADKVKQALSSVEGLADLRVTGQTKEPQIEVRVDVAAAGKVGLTPGDIRRAAATVFAGLEVGSLFEQQKVFDVVVWSQPSKRDSVTDLRELLIDTPSGDHVRLGDVAEIRISPTLSVIEREGISRCIDVVANVRGRDVNSAAADVSRVLQNMQFASEYYPVVFSESAERQSSQHLLLFVALASLLGIFFILQACFRSWGLALVIFATLPLALIGVFVAVHATGNSWSLGTLIGGMAVFAITVRHCILLIRHWQDMELRKEASFGTGLVRFGACERFASILMTMVAACAALSPFVFLGGIAGIEALHPMAIVILCGLVMATLFNLFVVPTLYRSFGSSPEPKMQFEGGMVGSAPQ
jgi:CzcA family heavy metal efflux pump